MSVVRLLMEAGVEATMARTGERLADAADQVPPFSDRLWWFRRLVRRMLFQTIHDVSLMPDRERAGHKARLDAMRKRGPWLRHRFVDGAYDRAKLLDKGR